MADTEPIVELHERSISISSRLGPTAPAPSLEMIQAALDAGADLASYCCDYCEED